MMIGNSRQDFYVFKPQFLVVKAYNWRISCIKLPSKGEKQKKIGTPKRKHKKILKSFVASTNNE
jgi:hypothetical protein